MSDKMREEFEAWIITVHNGARLNMGLEMVTSGARYASLEVEWAYRAWIASRAALVVELPKHPYRARAWITQITMMHLKTAITPSTQPE